jgi:nicotinate phosphoribosyltransferase
VSHQQPSGDWVNVAKTSAQKANIAGRKTALRRHDDHGVATAEVVQSQTAGTNQALTGASQSQHERNLIVDLMTSGVAKQEFVGPGGTANARKHHAEAIAALPAQALRLTRGEPGISTLLS